MSDTNQVLSVPIGADLAWEVDALQSDQVTPYAADPSDAIECVIWQGAGSAPLFNPAASWLNAPLGKLKISVAAAQTAALVAGVFPLEVTTIPVATGKRLRLLDAWFELTGSPGVSLLPPVYGSYQDMVDFGGGVWIESVRRSPQEGLSNFTRERSRARSYLDDLITRKFRARGCFADWGPIDGRNPTIRDYLAADYTPGVVLPNGTILAAGQTVLMVTDQVRELVALKALEFASRQRITLTDDDVFRKQADYFSRLASRVILTTTVELDTDQDGFADYAVNLGALSLR